MYLASNCSNKKKLQKYRTDPDPYQNFTDPEHYGFGTCFDAKNEKMEILPMASRYRAEIIPVDNHGKEVSSRLV
jgi:hypothetical protein